jgi:hypothetical protein
VHSVHVRSVGYIIQKDGKSVFYSSDMISIDRRHHRKLRGLDLVVTEGSFIRRGGMVRRDAKSGAEFGHAGIPDLVDFFRDFAPRVIITHFGSWFYRNTPAAIRQIEALGNGVRVTAAHDGMVLHI